MRFVIYLALSLLALCVRDGVHSIKVRSSIPTAKRAFETTPESKPAQGFQRIRKRLLAQVVESLAPLLGGVVGTGEDVLSLLWNALLVPGNTLPSVSFQVPDSYAGLLPAAPDGSKEIFFWYYPAEKDAPGQEDVVFWIGDGNACSSLQGMLQENGPFLVPFGDANGAPVQNEYSFTKLSHVVYVDWPVGVGFSKGALAADSAEAAVDFANFLDSFYTVFPQLNNTRLWFSGEAQAATGVAYIMQELIVNRAEDSTANVEYMGSSFYNPWFASDEFVHQMPAVDFAIRYQETMGLADEFIESLTSDAKKYNVTNIIRSNLQYPPRQEFDMSTSEELNAFDPWTLVHHEAKAANPCFAIENVAYDCPKGGDWSDESSDLLDKSSDQSDGLLKQATPTVGDYIDRKHGFRKAVNLPDDAKWNECVAAYSSEDGNDAAVPAAMNGMMDAVIDSASSGRTVIVSGDHDYVTLADGTALILQLISWGDQQGFNVPPHQSWMVDGQKVGTYTSERGLTYVRLDQIGHFVGMERGDVAFSIQKYLLFGEQDS